MSTRPTLFSHIQLATSLLRPYADDTEIIWRANHSDLAIGLAAVWADQLRAENPNIRIVGYFTNMYHRYAEEAEVWANRYISAQREFVGSDGRVEVVSVALRPARSPH